MLSLLISFSIEAKQQPTNTRKQRCGSDAPSVESEIEFQQKIQQFLAEQSTGNRQELANYTIPIVVHVVYYNAVENISDAQVNSQIDILNADYAGTGLNVNICPTAFQPLISNTNISFCKATKKPDGSTMAVAGIDRINAVTAGFSNPGVGSNPGWSKSYIDGTVKPATIWDPTKYMNVWVLPLQDGLLGYATFPIGTGLSGITGNGSATTDGVVIGYLYYGNTGTAAGSAPYNKGRTATHEVGHWLGLRHISGDSNCGDDFCGDTPVQSGNAGDGQGLNYGCPTFPSITCSNGPNGDLFQNFMDYTDDECMFLFTPNQRTRIQTAMANGTYRFPLTTSNVCTVTPAIPVANFSADKVSICPGGVVKFTDLSSGVPTSWAWQFPGGTPISSNTQNPSVQYNTAGSYAVTLTASNSLGSDGETKTAYINVGNPTTTALPIVQGFESASFPPSGWSLVNLSGFNWERTTLASGFGTSTASMRFNNTDNDALGKKDDIYSPTVNFPTGTVNPRIKFDVAYAPYVDGFGQENDTLEVLLFDVCSQTATSIYKKGGNQLSTSAAQGNAYVPTAGQWRKDSVTLTASVLNKYVKFIFRNYGLYGQSIYIDNVNIYGSTATTTPTASFTASDTTVCKGSTLTFTSNSSSGNTTAVDSVRWTINGGTPSTSNSSSVTPTFNTVGSFNISLIAYEGGVASAPVTKSIRVKTFPVAVTASSPTICSGQTATLQAGGATTYVWSPGGSINNPFTTTALTGNTTYTVTGTKDGCTGTATSTITVTPLPTVAALTGNTTVCVGSTTTLSSTTSGGVWSTSAPTIASVNNGVVQGIAQGTANIYYTVTANNCQKSVAATVTVNPVPTVSSITGLSSVCVNSSITLSSTTPNGVWSSSSNGIATVNGGVVTGVSNGSVEIRYTVTTNGCSTTATKIITVNALPTVAALTGNTTVCVGSTTTLSSTTAGGVWTTSAPTIASVNNGTVQGIAQGTANIYYTLTVNGCQKSVAATVTVNPIPNVQVNSPTICPNQTATLTATGATSYSWNPSGSINNPYTTPALASNATYVVTGTANGCSKTATATVTVNSTPPTVTINPRNPSVCLGNPVTLTVSGANTYIWVPGNVPGNSFTFTPTGITTIKVQGIAGTCSNPGYDSVVVTTKDKPNVTASSTTICAGQTATLQAGGASTYLWNPSNSNSNPYTTIALSGNTTYTVTGTATNGCINTATSTVTVTPLPTPTITRRNDTVFCNITGTQYKWYLNNVLLTTTSVAFLKVTQNGLYKVEVVNNNCTSLQSSAISVTLTGIRNNTINVQFSILPNPNNGLFEIKITSILNKTYQLKLYNVTGQIISDEEINVKVGENSRNMNLFGIEKGVYFLSIIGEDGVATKSILVQ